MKITKIENWGLANKMKKNSPCKTARRAHSQKNIRCMNLNPTIKTEEEWVKEKKKLLSNF